MPPLTPTSSPQLSTLRRKAPELFSNSSFSSNNAFEPNDFELEGRVSPLKLLRNAPVSAQGFALRISPSRTTTGSGVEGEMYVVSSTPDGSPTKTAMACLPVPPPCKGSVSPRISTPMVKSPAIDSLSAQFLAVPPNTPVARSDSTLRRKSADIFGSRDNMWDPEDSEFAKKLEIIRLNPTQRTRDNPLKSLRNSPSPTKQTRSPLFATNDRENTEPGYFDQHDSPSQRNSHTRFTPTEVSLSRTSRCSPLRSVTPSPKRSCLRLRRQ